jgi:uncharacterized membrane protein
MRALRPAVAFLSLFAALSLAPPAHAAPMGGLHLERADVNAYPLLKLYLTYIESDGRVVTGKTKDEFKLIFDSNEQGTAADAKPIDQTGEPIYMAVVVQVSGAMADALDEEKRGVRALAAAAADMKGSKVSLISYASETKRLAELVKPEELDGAAGGLVLDTEGSEVHLLDSVRTAIDLLNAKTVPDNARKLIVVFSDGLDVAGGEKKGFTELGKKALLANIVIDTIGYAPFEAGKLRNLNEMVKQSNGTSRECKNAQEVSAQFANVADELKKQYVVLFQSAILGDGKEHTVQVVTDTAGKPIYSNNVTKICEQHEELVVRTAFWKKWWFWVFCVVLPVILLVGLLITLTRGKEVEGMAMPQASPEAPAGPQRTMALDLGAITGKGPTVGWIVGVSGKYADQTCKLKAGGRTTIGTGADNDIQIEDGFMSSKHCEVRYDGNTYKIVDLGSTNGIVLNDKKVRESDLVDGDSFKLGRSEFKFKAIN